VVHSVKRSTKFHENEIARPHESSIGDREEPFCSCPLLERLVHDPPPPPPNRVQGIFVIVAGSVSADGFAVRWGAVRIWRSSVVSCADLAREAGSRRECLVW